MLRLGTGPSRWLQSQFDEQRSRQEPELMPVLPRHDLTIYILLD